MERIRFKTIIVKTCTGASFTGQGCYPDFISRLHVCTTRSSLPADRFHTRKRVVVSRSLPENRCEVSSRSEILAPGKTTGVNSRRHHILW